MRADSYTNARGETIMSFAVFCESNTESIYRTLVRKGKGQKRHRRKKRKFAPIGVG